MLPAARSTWSSSDAVQHDVAAALGVRRHAAELVEQEDLGAAERGDAGADGLDDAGVDRLGRGAGRQRDAGRRLVGEEGREARGDVLGPGVRRLVSDDVNHRCHAIRPGGGPRPRRRPGRRLAR